MSGEYGSAPFESFMDAQRSAEKSLTELREQGKPQPDSYFIIPLPRHPWESRHDPERFGWYAVAGQYANPVPSDWVEVLWVGNSG